MNYKKLLILPLIFLLFSCSEDKESSYQKTCVSDYLDNNEKELVKDAIFWCANFKQYNSEFYNYYKGKVYSNRNK